MCKFNVCIYKSNLEYYLNEQLAYSIVKVVFQFTLCHLLYNTIRKYDLY